MSRPVTIRKSVGRAPAPNSLEDMGNIRNLFLRIPREKGGPLSSIPEPTRAGEVSDQLQAAIDRFQALHNKVHYRDGRIDPLGQTLMRMNALAKNGPIPPIPNHVAPLPPPDPEELMIVCPGAISIPRMRQPKGPGSCWATAASMMYFWKNKTPDQSVFGSDDSRIRFVLDQTTSRTKDWVKFYELNNGLPPTENAPFFCNALGLKKLSGLVDFDVKFWRTQIKVGPIAVNTEHWAKNGQELEDRSHVIVVIGVQGSSLTTSKPDAKIWFIDPFSGKEDTMEIIKLASFIGWQNFIPEANQNRDRIFFW